ncbi:MAG TPA: hypothetical protein VLK25_02340 [Allosphingosinicella sp.]|nr:hypothetical protein [Allosphingosinicella sp.]
MAFRRAAVAALFVTTATAAAANVLVVRSSGPSAKSYPAGRSLPDNARLTLTQGDTVIVLTGGGTRTFRGPGTFSPNSAVRAGPRVATAADGRRARVGAVRNAGVLPRGGTIWDVDITQSGTFCVVGSRPVLLWRPDASLPISLQIITHDGASVTAQWAAGQPTLAWPSGTQLTSGAAYSFRTPGVAVPTQITFRTLASEPADLDGVAAALIENGCEGQLDLLIETQPASGS